MKRKKTKIKKKTIVILLIVFIFLFLLNPVVSIMKIKSKGYSLSNSYEIYKLGLKEEIIDKDYSETFEKIFKTEYYEEKYFDNYFEINYKDSKDFNKNINTWLILGYKPEIINKIYDINDSKLNEKISEKYIPDILSYLDYSYFKVDNLDRYLAYFNGDYSDTIIKVNIGLDKKYYEDPVIVTEYSTSMIVNKYNQLEDKYVPKDITELTKCSSSGEYLAKEAKEAYDELCDASKKAGLNLGVTSSYRSYENQKEVYNTYLKQKGKDYVEKYVALPGYSEHQTGLALDVKSTTSSPFKYTKESKWMEENAYKYGFILRYPEGMEEITGYNAESWHYRYVGKDIAKYIYENKITYDEYYAIFM